MRRRSDFLKRVAIPTLSILLGAWAGNAMASQPNMTILAGSSQGYLDGPALSAKFSGGGGLVQDSSGNIYVADGNRVIRKIAPDGTVSTLAGLAGAGSQWDGTGTGAGFNGPTGIALDDSGNLYVTDMTLIRKVTPAGVVTTIAGSRGTYGSQDGTGSYGLFMNPNGIALDSAGNIYVADTDNNSIRKVTQSGVVTTLAGSLSYWSWGAVDDTGSAARFHSPHGLAIDSAGNLYVADTGNNSIRKVTPGGVVTTILSGAAVGLSNIYGVTIDKAGSLYVLDGSSIQRVTSTGTVIPIVTGLNAPRSIMVGSTGTLYMADTNFSVIRYLAPMCTSTF